jgi:hypothetical protein
MNLGSAWAGLALAVLLVAGGWAGEGRAMSDVDIKVDPAKLAPERPGAAKLAKVEVSDIRKAVNQERTTIGGISMGQIRMQPPEAELIQALVEAEANAALARLGKDAAPETIYCGIREFQVETPATMLYWDVTTRIELVLRVAGQDRPVSAKATERTFVWPSQEIIQRVTEKALTEAAAQSGKALEELLAGR